MVELGGGGGSFPVVFFDGETETDIGDVAVSPSLDFKRFQSILGHRIGISPHQFSVHLSSPESRRKIPISGGKVNLAAISREKGCFFVVSLKRSRRERRRKSQSQSQNQNHFPQNIDDSNIMILKRTDGFGFGYGYESRVAELIMQRERYLLSMGLTEPSAEIAPPACQDCDSGRAVGFHWCVYDAVTFGFRSMAGPIARPYRCSD